MGVAPPQRLIGIVPRGVVNRTTEIGLEELPLSGRNCHLTVGIPDSGQNTNSDEICG